MRSAVCFLSLVCIAGCARNRGVQRADRGGGTASGNPLLEEVAARLELRIASDKILLRLTEHPNVQVKIVNLGEAPVTLVQPGDGSSCGWRTPLVGWSVVKAGDPAARHPPSVPLNTTARCGNINALMPEEVFVIPPGGNAALREWVGPPRLPGPGKYRMVFYYRNNPSAVWRGIPLGRHDPDDMKKVRSSTACSMVSNELEFTVREE